MSIPFDLTECRWATGRRLSGRDRDLGESGNAESKRSHTAKAGPFGSESGARCRTASCALLGSDCILDRFTRRLASSNRKASDPELDRAGSGGPELEAIPTERHPSNVCDRNGFSLPESKQGAVADGTVRNLDGRVRVARETP